MARVAIGRDNPESAPLVISLSAAAVTAARQGVSGLNLMPGRHAAVMQFY